MITSKHQKKDKTRKVQECLECVQGRPLQTEGVTVERRIILRLRMYWKESILYNFLIKQTEYGIVMTNIFI